MIAGNVSQPKGLRVAVLAGGESDEWEISLQSGAAVVDALCQRGHAAEPIDPAETPLESIDWSRFDVAFLALHGRFGEDGQVQTLLDRLEVAYTGSGPDASRLAFRKSAAKERFLLCGVPTPPYVLIHEADDRSRAMRCAASIGFPVVVKPDSQGSSLGVSIVQSSDSLLDALAGAFEFDDWALIERAVVGTEWTLGLLDEEPLPLIQIETRRCVFDYSAKYHDDSTNYRFEFSHCPDVVASIIEAGQNAARAIGTRGLSRVDLRLDGENRPWVLEVNTIPGLTSHSLVPMAARRGGLTLGALCEKILQYGLAATAARPGAYRGADRTAPWCPEAKKT